MRRKLEDILNEMEKCLVATMQPNILGPNFKSIDELCVEWLKARGHSVRPPMGHPVKITKLDELISMFNGFLDNTYDRHLLPYSNEKKDRAIAKAFVENRMNHDKISYETALEQCGLIIQIIFTRKDIFRFETPPTFSIFGQAEMGWVTDRAVQLINQAITKDITTETERAVDKMTKEIEEKCQMGRSLAELQEISKKLEDQYGKEER